MNSKAASTDKHGNNSVETVIFKIIKNVYSTLSDQEKRAAYDEN